MADGRAKNQKNGPDATEAAPDRVQTGRAIQELQIVHRASLALHELRDVEILARDIIGFLQEIMHHDFAAVYLIDGDLLRTFAVSDRGLGEETLAVDKAYLDSLDLRVGNHITGWVAKHGKSVRLADVRLDPRYLDSQPGVVSELCVPMRLHDRTVGVINLESSRPGAYSASDQRVLEIVASQIAIAIENARMHERTAGFVQLRMMRELAAGIAHDLGNLMLVASGTLELAGLQNGERRLGEESLEQLRFAIGKSAELTRGLLDLGRERTGAPAIVSLNDLVRSALPLLNVLAGPTVELSWRPSKLPCPLRADAGRIEQVLMNLVVNARQAGASRIELSTLVSVDSNTADGKRHVQLVVRDDGDGMDAATAARALEPFFTTRSDGTGLGLSTVQRIVASLEGSLRVESEPGQGASFVVRLPLADA